MNLGSGINLTYNGIFSNYSFDSQDYPWKPISSATYTSTFSETITLTDGFSKGVTKLLPETLTLTDSIIKAIGRIFSEILTLTDSLGFVVSSTGTPTVIASYPSPRPAKASIFKKKKKKKGKRQKGEDEILFWLMVEEQMEEDE